MSIKKIEVEQVDITQVENGYILMSGSMCGANHRDRYVFQTFNELVDFLKDHFHYRNSDILVDSYNLKD